MHVGDLTIDEAKEVTWYLSDKTILNINYLINTKAINNDSVIDPFGSTEVKGSDKDDKVKNLASFFSRSNNVSSTGTGSGSGSGKKAILKTEINIPNISSELKRNSLSDLLSTSTASLNSFKNFKEKNDIAEHEIKTRKSNNIISSIKRMSEVKSLNESPFTAQIKEEKVRILMEHKIVQISTFEDKPEDSFCEAFFSVGLNPKDTNIITGSERFLACCKHQECSKMLAYKSSLINRMPYKDNKKIELNAVVRLILVNKFLDSFVGFPERHKNLF